MLLSTKFATGKGKNNLTKNRERESVVVACGIRTENNGRAKPFGVL